MSLKETLTILRDVANDNNIHTPYIVGGLPRNILLNELESLNDIDVTTMHEDINQLADLFAEKIGVEPKIFEDGHRRVYVNDLQIDFSSHAIYGGLDELIGRKLSPLEKDAYSRDFTINALYVPLDFSEIIDPTGKGINDIEQKLIRCTIKCDIVFGESPNRIIRAFYYAAKYNLKIADSTKQSIKSNLNLLDTVKGRYSSKKIAEAIRLLPSLLDDLIETGVLSKIPLTKEVVNTLIKERKLNKVV